MMTKRSARISVLGLALAAAVAVATAGTAAPERIAGRETKRQRALDQVVAAGVPGAVLLVREGDRTIRLTSGFGNRASKSPIRASDRFRIGSVTKTFVATVVLQLAGERKLSLEDSLEHWLPAMVPNGQRITVRRLLNMTSGLYDYTNDPRIARPYLAGNFGYVWTPRRLIGIAVSHKPLFAPGTSWAYCNTCYVVLGLIVEQATGHSIGAELNRRIFTPLHLRATTFDTQQRMAEQHSHGYFRDGKQLVDRTLLSPSPAWAAGAIVSTADDVATFFRALYRGRLLRPELLRAMRTTVAAYSQTARYGLGLARFPTRCGTLWGNHGDITGFSTDAWNSKDAQRQFVLFTNLDEESLSKRSSDALDQLRDAAACG
jgi:D-alanyl-D-alanine carboxypeptidase